MKKLLFAILILTASSVKAHTVDRYGGWYNVEIDSSPYDLHYRFYQEVGKTGINDFEYRSMMDDIYAVWGSTFISECSRYKIVNALLEKRVDNYLKYPEGVFRSSVPFDLSELSKDCVEGLTFDDKPPQTEFRYNFEAEEGILSGLDILISSTASGGHYISAGTADFGTASYIVNITSAGTYYVWGKVLSLDGSRDSFYTYLDGINEEIYDTSTNTWSPDWQWTLVNKRVGGQPDGYRSFDLSIGTHTISFRGREVGTGLDKIQITNKR